ncbi:MAG: RuBisCO large subunit C-terminal-like domain-containing protein [Planctomycetota bacterium]|nr:RuBisCO large subunit C-terminal-like domain-containing protein [Planctomycetota bacterium]
MGASVPLRRQPSLSGERFVVEYRLAGQASDAPAKARDICLEQTVEFPEELVPPGAIRDQIIGRVESLEPAGPAQVARISYAVETAGGELCQLLNVIFGNTSIKPGVRVERLELPPSLLAAFRGPRFGCEGLRSRAGAAGRPLLCSALKPMGLTAADLADLAYQFALGGLDMIKDDHGLADQSFSPFEERITLCAAAVARANKETGGHCDYYPNVTGEPEEMKRRAQFAKAAGAGGLVVSPGLAGLSAMKALADDDSLALPIMSHPAFLGSFVAGDDSGISHAALFGQIMRLAGADSTVFPNFGGRFSFSRPQCSSIASAAAAPMGSLRPIFPAPGGGMSLDRIADMRSVYGADLILLIGGGLFRHGPNLTENCLHFRRLAEAF